MRPDLSADSSDENLRRSEFTFLVRNYLFVALTGNSRRGEHQQDPEAPQDGPFRACEGRQDAPDPGDDGRFSQVEG